MKLNDIIRKLMSILFWICLIYSTIAIIINKANIFNIILCIGYYGIWVFYFILKLIYYIMSYRKYKTATKRINLLKALHQKRHKLYFSSNYQELKECSLLFDYLAKDFIEVCNFWLEKNQLTKKHAEYIRTYILALEALQNKS